MKFKNSESDINFPDLKNCTVAVIGLGYVGLPIAVELAKTKKCNLSGDQIHRKVIGFDIDKNRLLELEESYDRTNEISQSQLKDINFHKLTSEIIPISEANVFIVTVPTPIDNSKKPDLKALKDASSTVGKALKIRSKKSSNLKDKSIPVIIFESTVYPGTTEEICIPIIEKESGLFLNKDKEIYSFAYGYSPERINPGDKDHTLIDIKKITSGNNQLSAEWIKNFYLSFIKAGIFPAKSIMVAEAAKIIENTQRDLNIALVNEFAKIFKLMNIDTLDVIDAASSKWNFIPFKPGLVGGHCIGVDPYYLTYKAESLGFSPEVVLAGRKTNDQMSEWVADQIIFEAKKRNFKEEDPEILILGITFKENCSDIRNTKVVDLIKNLKKLNYKITVIDPQANPEQVINLYSVKILKDIPLDHKFNIIVATVAHKEFIKKEDNFWSKIITNNGFFFDLKGYIPTSLDTLRI